MAVESRPLTQDIGLFLVLVLAADTLFAGASGEMTARMLMWSFYLMTFVHVGQSLYRRSFSRPRTVTWVALIVGWTVAEILSFTGHILPVGQVLFWVALNMPWAAAALEWLMANACVMPATLLAVLAIDIAALHARREFSWPSFGLLSAAALIVAFVVRLAYFHIQPQPGMQPAPTFDLMPPWHLLPFYAIMRSIPDKTAGVALAFAAILAPVIWPWMNADALRRSSLRWIWRLAWLVFVAAFLGLGYLGTQMPDDNVILASRFLAAWYFAFLLLVPVLLRRFSRP